MTNTQNINLGIQKNKMTMVDNKENMIQITRDRHSSHSGPSRWEGGPAVQHEVKLSFLIKP